MENVRFKNSVSARAYDYDTRILIIIGIFTRIIWDESSVQMY